jgi:hypothetical protein
MSDAMPQTTFPTESELDPRITEGPLPEDFGIPRIDLDRQGRFKVPKLKADYCLLEEANNEFFLGMGLDEPRPIAWLWPERIAIGKLTLVEGESGSGTSFLVADMAARVSTGNSWPGSSRPADDQAVAEFARIQATRNHPNSGECGHPANKLPNAGQSSDQGDLPPPQPAEHVIIVNGGDNMHDTLLPRLMAMGANLYDFTINSGITTHDPAEMRAGKADTRRGLCLPADLGHIEYQVRKRPDTRLVVVDSLSDFCHTEKQFRETVRGLHEIAERCHVAVVATARPKNGRSARNKLKPSADRRSESARCVLNVLVDPKDPSQRYLAPARMNFCREPKWLPFRIGEGVIDWGQPIETAPVYQRPSPAAQEKSTLLKETADQLHEMLSAGDLPAKIAIRQLTECGFSKGTILRARRELGARSYRIGYGARGLWCWSITPEGECPPSGQEPQDAENGQPGERVPAEAGEFSDTANQMLRALFAEALERQAPEMAAKAKSSSNGQTSKNGKRSKNGKARPR